MKRTVEWCTCSGFSWYDLGFNEQLNLGQSLEKSWFSSSGSFKKTPRANNIDIFKKPKLTLCTFNLQKLSINYHTTLLYHNFFYSSAATLQVFWIESWLDVTWENRTCEVIQMWILIFSCAFNLSFFLVTWCLLFAPLNIRLIRWGSKLYY